MSTLRVATWNVLFRSRTERSGLLADHLRAVDADVVLLQETDAEHAEEMARRIGLFVADVDVDSERPHVGVAVLWSATLAAARSGPTDRIPLSPMYAEATTVVDGRTLRFASTHLSNTPEAWRLTFDRDYRAAATDRALIGRISDTSIRHSVARRMAQLDELLSYRASTGAQAEVLGGDFNCVPRGVEYNTMLASGLHDAWTAGPRIGAGTTVLARNPLIGDGQAAARVASAELPGFDADPDYALDFQFHSPSVTPRNAWTFGEARAGRWASDHLGIAVDYTVR